MTDNDVRSEAVVNELEASANDRLTPADRRFDTVQVRVSVRTWLARGWIGLDLDLTCIVERPFA